MVVSREAASQIGSFFVVNAHVGAACECLVFDGSRSDSVFSQSQ